jgi:hypothetical protein
LILCIAVIKLDNNTHLYLQDISQAYIQSAINLNHKFYIRLSQELETELRINKDSVLKVLKPLYSVPEARNHWFKTYYSHYVQQLYINQLIYNLYLLYNNVSRDSYFNIVGLQTNNTLFFANNKFTATEQNKLYKAQFIAKEHKQLSIDKLIKFNNSIIYLTEDSITLS